MKDEDNTLLFISKLLAVLGVLQLLVPQQYIVIPEEFIQADDVEHEYAVVLGPATVKTVF
jgi:hypothetical protein